jgi:hypothetical protein
MSEDAGLSGLPAEAQNRGSPSLPAGNPGPARAAAAASGVAPVETCANCGQPFATPSGRSPGASSPAGGWSGPVFGVGKIVPQIPSLGVEKHIVQLAGGLSHGFVETTVLRDVLSVPENRYLGRHVCWVLTSQQVDAFAVVPRDEADIVRLVELLPSDETDDVIHVVIGRAGLPAVAGSPCAQAGLPLVVADQPLLGFTLDEFASAMPDAEPGRNGEQADQGTSGVPAPGDGGLSRDQFNVIVRDVFRRITQRAGNLGRSDEHRALNHLAVQYPKLYHAVAQAHRERKTLVDITARHAHSSTRRLVSVELVFLQRQTDISERYQCLVDVTPDSPFPFLATRLQQTFG